MKTVSKLILLAGLFGAPFALLAKSSEQAYVESFQGRSDVPVPISVVSPQIQARYAGRTVVVEFIVDATGTPGSLKLRDGHKVPAELGAPILVALAQWRFAPLVRDGVGVSVPVAVPVTVVDRLDSSGMLATR